MIAENFARSLEFISKWEGGWSDHPKDPGGKTMWGITLRTFREWSEMHDYLMPTANVLMEMPRSTAERIYKEMYWDSISASALPSGIDLACFDCAVNQGPGRAARFLQHALRVTVDGQIGPETLGAASRANGEEVLLWAGAYRAMHYSSLSTLITFGHGWFRRMLDCHYTARLLLQNGKDTNVVDVDTDIVRKEIDYAIRRSLPRMVDNVTDVVLNKTIWEPRKPSKKDL